MNIKNMNRRKFLGGALAGAGALLAGGCARTTPSAPTIIPRHVLGGQPSYVPPSQKLRVAQIGCGGRGAVDLDQFKNEAVVALCDVDWNRAAKAVETYPNVPRFKDFRVMLEKMGDEIDAVVVSTPDHTHAVATLMAINMGKHVMVQKPLTHNIAEVRALREASRRMGVVTQMCNQIHATEDPRRLCEWIWAGAIGSVREVHIWTDRPVWPQGDLARPAAQNVPDHIDWDLWLGPAEFHPYNEAYHPFKWRGWVDFGTGALGDMGCHILDVPYWALDMAKAPSVTISAEFSPFNGQAYPEKSIVTYEFPAHGSTGPVKLVWYDGGNMPPRPAELPADREMRKGGQIWIGEKGVLMAESHGQSPRLIPEEKMESFMENRPEPTLWRSPGAFPEFIQACKGGPACGSNFEYSVPLTELVLLGCAAIRAGQPITYDMTAGQITSDRRFNSLLSRPYRKGWEI